MFKKVLMLIGVAALLAACQDSVSRNQNARILAVGDSLMSWNSSWGSSIPDVMQKELGETVVDRSISGAWMNTRKGYEDKSGVNIPYQYEEGDWDWVVVSGGGNDLLFGCGCGFCDKVLDRLISEDGLTGQIPDFFRRIRDDGAQVLYTGYLRSPNLLTPIEHCKAEGDELEARVARLASQEPGIVYASMQHIVPPGGISYFSADLIHPSRKSSRLMGERLAEIIRDFDGR